MVTIMSVPRTGTRFYWYFVTSVLGLNARAVHFFPRNKLKIERWLGEGGLVIVPVRDDADTIKSHGTMEWLDEGVFEMRDEYMPRLVNQGAHFMDTVKSDRTYEQFAKLLEALEHPITMDVVRFIDEWEPVGSQYNDTERSRQVTETMKKTMRRCN